MALGLAGPGSEQVGQGLGWVEGPLCGRDCGDRGWDCSWSCSAPQERGPQDWLEVPGSWGAWNS